MVKLFVFNCVSITYAPLVFTGKGDRGVGDSVRIRPLRGSNALSGLPTVRPFGLRPVGQPAGPSHYTCAWVHKPPRPCPPSCQFAPGCTTPPDSFLGKVVASFGEGLIFMPGSSPLKTGYRYLWGKMSGEGAHDKMRPSPLISGTFPKNAADLPRAGYTSVAVANSERKRMSFSK
jgi:hypothetical protein